MEDKQIVALFLARKEQAIAETAGKYGRYCHYIAYRILENDADAEEIVNDTYLKTWHTIPPQEPASLKAYVGMLARQLAFNEYAKQHTQKRGGGEVALVLEELAECIPDRASGEDLGESLALREALGRFVRALPAKKQRIFVRRYFYSAPISELAQEHDMKETHVLVVLSGIRKKLKKYLEQEHFSI